MGRCPDRQMHPLRCSRLRWPLPFPVHTHGDRGVVGEGGRWGEAVACCHWAFLGRRLGTLPASCQLGAARDVGAAFLLAVAVFVIVVAFVVAAGAAAVARDQAGAGSPRDSTSSQQRVLITPFRDAIWRCSDAIIACSAVGGGGGGGGGGPGEGGGGGRAHRPFHPLERERLRTAPSSMVAGGALARKGASATPMAVRTTGRCRRAAS